MRLWTASFSLFRSRVREGHLQRGSQFIFAERRERRGGPALAAPCVGDRREGFGGQQAFELLFVGRKLEISRGAVGRERRESDARLERSTVEMRIFHYVWQGERDSDK